MFCSKCGGEIPEGALFCSACGAEAPEVESSGPSPEPSASSPATSANVASSADAQQSQLDQANADQANPDQVNAGQANAESAQARKRLSPVVLALIIAAAIAAVAFIAVTVINGNSADQNTKVTTLETVEEGDEGSESDAESNADGQAESDGEQEQELTPEQEFIKSLDGWWTHGARQEIYGDNVCYIHDGISEIYSADGEKQEGGRTYEPKDLLRCDSGLADESRGLFNGGPGWFIYGPDGSSSGLYVSDEFPDTMSPVNQDGTGYSGGDSICRIDPPEWADEIEKAASEKSKNSDSSSGKSSDPEVAANQEKIDAAVAEGKQVFAGKIVRTDYDTAWTMNGSPVGNPNAEGGYYDGKTVTVFQPDRVVVMKGIGDVSSQYNDGAFHMGPTQNECRGVIEISDSFADEYDGQNVVMAFAEDGISFPTDVSFAKGTDCEVLFAGNTDGLDIPGQSSSSAASSSGDYILPESDKRVYSVDEIRAMYLSAEELKIARNEIFARHGRGFKDADLQSYFDSKDWYQKTCEPGEYEEDKLTDIERENVNNIKVLE